MRLGHVAHAALVTCNKQRPTVKQRVSVRTSRGGRAGIYHASILAADLTSWKGGGEDIEVRRFDRIVLEDFAL